MVGYELRVTKIHGLIGINKSDAFLSVSTSPVKLRMDTEPAQLNIRIKNPRVLIDQSQCFSEAGLKGFLELTDDYAKAGRGGALKAITQIVAEGNRMADIKNKASAIAEIAASKVFQPPDEFNITLMPKSRPKIDVVGGISIDVRPGRVNIDTVSKPVEISATKPGITLYWKQQPSFSMEFVGKNLDVNV